MQISENAGTEAKRVLSGEVLLAEFKVQIVKRLCLNGVNMEAAISIGQEMSEYLVQRWGGEAIYMPKRTAAVISARNAAICTEVKNGASRQELAAKYGLASEQIRKLLQAAGEPIRLTPGDEFLACLESQISIRVFGAGVNEKSAEVVGQKVIEHLAHHFSSLVIYIPKMAFKASADRYVEIYKEFGNGVTHRELAAKYSITVRQVYSILRKVRISRQEAGKKRERLR